MSNPVDTVIFDLGNVLIAWDPRRLYRQLIDDEERMDWFLREVCNSAWNEQQDAGRPWSEATALLRGRYPEHADPHLAAAMPHLSGDYMGEHWLASFALLALLSPGSG